MTTNTITSTKASTVNPIPNCAAGGRRMSYRRTSAGVIRLLIEQRTKVDAPWSGTEYAVVDLFGCETRFAHLGEDTTDIVVVRDDRDNMACNCKDRRRASAGLCKHCAAARVLLARGLFNTAE